MMEMVLNNLMIKYASMMLLVALWTFKLLFFFKFLGCTKMIYCYYVVSHETSAIYFTLPKAIYHILHYTVK